MIRAEIIANHSVEDNILEALAEADACKFYTKHPVVFGVGKRGPRMGDAVWPEQNFAIVCYCDEAEFERIKGAVEKVKAEYGEEGIKVFRS
jgi:hypothetical protein